MFGQSETWTYRGHGVERGVCVLRMHAGRFVRLGGLGGYDIQV